MRILMVSNRLPVEVYAENEDFCAVETQEGMASGLLWFLKSKLNANTEYFWFGTGQSHDHSQKFEEFLTKHRIMPVNVPREVKEFSERFCTRTIWPLFHYFPSKTSYDARQWRNYVLMNEAFASAIQEKLRDGDVLWILDYHLMLLPQMLRKTARQIAIGFFLNIPFPAYEIFRQLPSSWSIEILSGLEGSDLIGFQTDGYAQSFVRCAERQLSLEQKNNRFGLSDRSVQIGTFPTGIDFEKFHNSASNVDVASEIEIVKKSLGNRKIILSVDRLDYSKGILNRLNAYEKFLENNKSWHEKITLFSVVVPSLARDEQYSSMKKKIDETVGRINGKYGSFEWNPVMYQYQFLSFKKLAALYNCSEMLIVTPLREGMNLIAKEYVASRRSMTGVLVLSEMTGAAKELTDAILVNPNDIDAIVYSIEKALTLPLDEQGRRMEKMRSSIKTNDIFHWANSFLKSLALSISDQEAGLHENPLKMPEILMQYQKSSSRILFLDYDGTLVPFLNHPEQASPSERVKRILRLLTQHRSTEVVLISGRPRKFMEKWFAEYPVNLIAEHGAWVKKMGQPWELLTHFDFEWKSEVFSILNRFQENLPGSFIEEKEYTVVFHYRVSDSEHISRDLPEIKNTLSSIIDSSKLEIIGGNKILEIRPIGVNKGKAVSYFLDQKEWAFILALGDDRTDEDMFLNLPDRAITVKVGPGKTAARFNVDTYEQVLEFLEYLTITEVND